MAHAHATGMQETDYRRVIDELQTVIQYTRHLIDRFEATGLDRQMPGDFDHLHAIHNRAIKDQTFYTRAMLTSSPD